jgi:CubicO group peptidase (beta-lactamase class C family)
MSFATVFMTSHAGMDFGSYRAFGHDGAGGAIGCADPSYDLAFGYVPASLQLPGGADPKGLHLNQIARSCLQAQKGN